MADEKISALPSAGALAGTEPLPIVQGGATKQTTVQDIADLAAGNQTLAQTLANGNVTGGTNVKVNNADAIELENTSLLKKGTYDFGGGGGISRICSVGYEDMWQAGIHHVFDNNGYIRESTNCFDYVPDSNFDETLRFKGGSRWVLDDGTIYTCLNAATGAAIWVQESSVPNLQQVTDSDNTTTNPIVVNAGGGDKIEVSDTSIKITNVLGGVAVIQSQSLNSTTFFELPDKATSQTFAMLEDVTGDVVGPASAVDNNIATFDGTTGKLIQDGGTTIADINTNAVDRITVKLAQSITKGQAVYISGANGTNILVSKADNTTEATSSKTLGLLETTGATNAIVNVVTNGLLDGLDTSAATAVGDAVWLGTSGNLIFGLASKPYAPAHLVYIGVVSRKSATVGEIIVNIQNGFELKEIHDVSAQTPANKNGLFYNTSTSLWEARAVAATDIDANVSNTEFGYLDGVTSSIQTQLNGKQATLVSGTNIKSVEGSTLLGSTALVISREIQIACSDETTALTAGTSKVTFRAPRAMVITGVRASLTTAQTSGSIFTVDINDSGTSILSTKITIDNTEKTSTTAATPPVISDTAIADDAEITIDIDQIGDGTAKGLKVTILYTI